MFVVGSGFVLLLESERISATTFLRSGAIVTAAVQVGLALWVWRRIGLYIRAFGPNPKRDAEDPLASATTGEGALEAIGNSILARLPLQVGRVVTVAILLVTGMLAVLGAFSASPEDKTELWQPLLAGADFALFAAAGVQALVLLVIGSLVADEERIEKALRMVASMVVLLLIAWPLGWLDEWQTAISWTGCRLS